MKGYKFISDNGEYSISELEKIIVFKSDTIKGYISTINYPTDWGLTRVMQHIINFDEYHTAI